MSESAFSQNWQQLLKKVSLQREPKKVQQLIRLLFEALSLSLLSTFKDFVPETIK